ncbi:MAG: hypothetical protein KIB51_04050 [Dysgonomonas mossii]|jgi:hypothetical protein|nr:hypothetical protein [Dysgonomonas mossii]
METFELIIGGIILIAMAGGSVFAYKKTRSNKSSNKNITIQGNGKVVGGDDNSINIDKE